MEFAIGINLAIEATQKLSGEGVKRPWPPLINMNKAAKALGQFRVAYAA